jgi:hypothetical protein
MTTLAILSNSVLPILGSRGLSGAIGAIYAAAGCDSIKQCVECPPGAAMIG